MATTDLTRLPLEIVVDAINLANGTEFVVTDFIISAPSARYIGNRNTAIVVTATATSKYNGPCDLSYNRIDLDTVPGTRNVEFDLFQYKTAHDLIPDINAAFQLNLQPEDIEDDLLPIFEVGDVTPQPFRLRAKTGSYVFIGTMNLIIHPGNGPTIG